MSDALEQVLQLVADGRLSADEAAPILAALDAADGVLGAAGTAAPPRTSSGTAPRFARIEVAERGRRIVDLRIPISLGRIALSRVPGISSEQVADVEAAIAAGSHGPILDVRDEDGDSVRIVLE